MKKRPSRKRVDDLRPVYDLSKLKGGVRGKYYVEATAEMENDPRFLSLIESARKSLRVGRGVPIEEFDATVARPSRRRTKQ